MSNLTTYQQTILAAWQQHTYAEFGLKDPEAALASMTEDPYVLNIPSGTGRRQSQDPADASGALVGGSRIISGLMHPHSEGGSGR
jgi:hypothetical protein